MTYCSCKECLDCCKHLPGIFKPNEVEKAAKGMNIPLPEFLRRFCIVGWREGIQIGEKIYDRISFIYPAKVGKQGLEENRGYPFSRGDCIFLSQQGLCSINANKPYECLKTFGCRQENRKFNHEALLEWVEAKEKGTIHPDILEFMATAKMMTEKC